MSCWICKPGLTSKKQSRDQFEGETSRIDAAEQCAVLGVRYATEGRVCAAQATALPDLYGDRARNPCDPAPTWRHLSVARAP